MKLQRGITKSSKKGGITGRGEWVFDPLTRALPLIYFFGGGLGDEMSFLFWDSADFRGLFFAVSFREGFVMFFFLASHLFLPCHKQMQNGCRSVQTCRWLFRCGGADLWAGATNQFRRNLGRSNMVKAAVLWGRFQESLPL